jgi:hypothetical protein
MIVGNQGRARESFISRDRRYPLFSNLNERDHGSALGGADHKTDLLVAWRVGDRFTPALEYAAAISLDVLEVFFTRMTGALLWRKLTVEHAARESPDAPVRSVADDPRNRRPRRSPEREGRRQSALLSRDSSRLFRIFRVSRP